MLEKIGQTPQQKFNLGNFAEKTNQIVQKYGAPNFMSPSYGVEAPSAGTGIGQMDTSYSSSYKPDFSEFFQRGSSDAAPKTEMPFAEGKWATNAKLGLGAAQVGLGIYNAMQQTKMNKFMQSYYNTQMDLMKTDFSNAARSSNEALHSREQRVLSAQGHDINSQEMQQGVADKMSRWGAKETV